MNTFIKSKILNPMMHQNINLMFQPSKSVLSPLSKADFDILKNKILGTETTFVRPAPKLSMLNRTEDDLQQDNILSGMVAEESGNVKLYKTPNNFMNKLEKPEQSSLVFINGVFAFSGYPYSIELTPEKLQGLDFDIVTKSRFFEANEGTVIRVFNANGNWYTITNKKLDAFCSKWAAKTKTFGCHLAKSIFVLLNSDHNGDTPDFDDVTVAKEYVNRIWSDSLDPTKRYFFLLKSSNEERIVCDADAEILNIGIIDENNTLSLDESVKLTDSLKNNTVVVRFPIEYKFSNLDDLIEKINNIDPYKCCGVLAIFKTDFSGANIENDIEQHIHVKLLNPKYKYLHSLRGNTPSLRFRLFQLTYLTNREMQLNQVAQPYVEDFKQLYYPQCEDMSKVFMSVVEDVFQKYQSKYVKHETVSDQKMEKMEKILNIIHNEYLISKKQTTPQRVSDILHYVEPEKLNQLIREYEYETKIKQQTYTNSKLPQ